MVDKRSNICRKCGCTPAQAKADALVLGLREEFEWGLYDCCELVGWADEQWQAFTEAAIEDCKDVERVTAMLAVSEA
jgi:hypothetical protein